MQPNVASSERVKRLIRKNKCAKNGEMNNETELEGNGTKKEENT